MIQTRGWFLDFFNGVKKFDLDLSNIPPEYHKTFKDSHEIEFSFYSLSDATVITVPLGGDDENCKAMNGVNITLLSICGLASMALAHKVVLRGGIDVGIATQIDDKEVYGSALVRAIDLESEVAEYPRFVVGNELLQFLEAVSKQNSKTILGKIAKVNADQCRNMIVQDTDGRQILFPG